jgi:hypothetical protein
MVLVAEPQRDAAREAAAWTTWSALATGAATLIALVAPVSSAL